MRTMAYGVINQWGMVNIRRMKVVSSIAIASITTRRFWIDSHPVNLQPIGIDLAENGFSACL